MPTPPLSSTIVTKRPYYREFDGVRAVATAMVMIFHLAQQGISIPGPVILGQTGVDLFFVLSGFLITNILLKSPQGDWHEVRTFYIRRSLRIFPLYYLFLVVAMIFGLHCSWPFWVYLQNIWLAHDWAIVGPIHLWSLAVEEQFYLVWPFIVLFLPRRWLPTALWTMILGAFACRFVLLHTNISPFFYTLSRLDDLAAGALLALWHSQQTLARRRRLLLGIFFAALAMIAVIGQLIAHTTLSWVRVTKFTCFAALYTSFLGLLLIHPRTSLSTFLRSTPLRLIGRISYGLYIFHPLIFAFVLAHTRHQPALVRATAAIGATLLVALLSWFCFERHLIALKDRLAPERAKLPPRVSEIDMLQPS